MHLPMKRNLTGLIKVADEQPSFSIKKLPKTTPDAQYEGIDYEDAKKKLDESGFGSEITLWPEYDGSATLSPYDARINLYRHIYKQVRGDNYREEDAVTDATNDRQAANKRRYAALKERGLLPKEQIAPLVPIKRTIPYDMGYVYTIPTHISYTGERFPLFSHGFDEGIDVGHNGDSRAAYMVDGQAVDEKPVNITRYINIGDPYDGKDFAYTLLHEGTHAFAPVNDTQSGSVSYWNGMGDNAEATKHGRIGYASQPSELLVGIAAEKARLRAMGEPDDETLGLKWLVEQLKNVPPTTKEVETSLANEVVKAPKTKIVFNGLIPKITHPQNEAIGALDSKYFDYFKRLGYIQKNNNTMTDGLNVGSLRGILFDLWDAANRPDATDDDRKRLQDFIRAIIYYFPLAENTRNNGTVQSKVAEQKNKFSGLKKFASSI